MPWSNNGTVQVSSGGTIAAGTGTTFLSSARVGDALTIAGSTSLHEVTAIASDTQLTFQPPYTGTTGSGKAYRIAPIMGYDKDLSDAFNSIRLQWGTQLSSLQPWATAATADIALANLGGSAPGTAVFKGDAAAGRTALGLGNAATRAVQTSPTDTTAGALMAVGAFGLGGANAGIANTDLNALSKTGFYMGENIVNAPLASAGWFYVLHQEHGGSGYSSQIAIDLTSLTPKTYQRQKTGGAWSTWYEMFHTGNILGPVYQSAGVPIGAIIERGSNANGEYVRFADGTQICWIEKTVTGLSIPVGGVWNTGTFNLPVAFVGQRWSSFELSAVNAQSAQPSYPVVNSLAGPSPSLWALTVYNAAGATIGVVHLAFICVGRWY